MAAVALLAALQCSAGSAGEAPATSPYLDAAAKKAAEEVVAVPIGLIWKDLYEALVHSKGSRALRKLRYRTAGAFKKNDALELTRFLMSKLKTEVFNDRVNQQAWDTLTMELYFALKDWWSNTPEDPKEAADLGAWHAMVSLYKDVLAPALRGSRHVASMNELLLDPDLKNIKKWVGEWKGASAATKTSPRQKEASKKPEGKASTAGSD